MSNIIGLNFNDFRAMVKDRRLYYYIGENYYDLHFLIDGIIVKTSVLKEDIKNEKRFFSDPIFYGAMELTFPIREPDNLDLSVVKEIRRTKMKPLFSMDNIQDEEVEQEDIQRSGVD